MRIADVSVSIPELDKKPGLSYATTIGGIELPVIDVAHPAFELEPSGPELAAMLEKSLHDLQRQDRTPPFIRSLMLRFMLRGSLLASAIGGARGGFVSGTGIYMLKLGPDNLGKGYAKKVDRAIASSLPCLCARLRLRDTAGLLAESLRGPLSARPGAGLSLLNVAGGAASDSLNALMLLARAEPSLLAGRKTRIVVLDKDEAAPAFGARCLDALLAEGGALAGLDVELQYAAYDWNEPGALQAELVTVDPSRDLVALSSEGGLFEYGSDEDIAGNLGAFAQALPPGTVFVGSMSVAEGKARLFNEASEAALRLRSLPELIALAEASSWRLGRVLENPLSRVFALVRAG